MKKRIIKKPKLYTLRQFRELQQEVPPYVSGRFDLSIKKFGSIADVAPQLKNEWVKIKAAQFVARKKLGKKQ